jgi:hypothetical protein
MLACKYHHIFCFVLINDTTYHSRSGLFALYYVKCEITRANLDRCERTPYAHLDCSVHADNRDLVLNMCSRSFRAYRKCMSQVYINTRFGQLSIHPGQQRQTLALAILNDTDNSRT